ncbi:hypothetical protein B0I08_103307 [Glaciihabitans tibetensis]|uniref:Lipoprotein n=1 Tax=Glaciihabitans tibetensis TaxID=1266600 RepID=A0A2T0VFX7_9MICO|nr:hypothetical protein [Glaciihabitans tibetensis]PRY69101.1 hypothetical protein B0I08_103307 [Glaciihabitans tibetensis]
MTESARIETASRRALRGTLALGAALALGGCAYLTGVDPIACPAIGWTNKVSVEIVGPADGIDDVRLCVDEVCTAGPTLPSDSPPVVVNTFAPSDSATFTPSPEQSVIAYGFASRIDDDTWSIAVDMSSPDDVTVQALSADGVVVAETVAELEWTRVGGSAECGGPGAAGPVELVIER